MNEKVRNKLSEVAGGLDLSSIMPPVGEEPTLGEIAGISEPMIGMPEIGVQTVYEEIAPKLSVLSSDEMLELISMALNDRFSSIAEEPMMLEQEMWLEALPPVV